LSKSDPELNLFRTSEDRSILPKSRLIVMMLASFVGMVAIGWAAANPDLSKIMLSIAIAGILLTVVNGLLWARESNQHFVSLLKQLNLSEISLTKLAPTDPQTGLMSMHWFELAVQREVSRSERYSQPCTIVFSTLNTAAMEKISIHARNSDPGYLLRFMADIAQATVRDSDIVARIPSVYGFAVLMPQTTKTGALVAVERLRERLSTNQIELVDGISISVEFRSTVLEYPEDAADSNELLAPVLKAKIS